jgi:hypothetical protein
MYVLFDKVHIYIKQSEFTLARYIHLFQKHPVILHSHIDSTEILIINVDDNASYTHGIIDIPVLNATAVSDFKKTLRKK